MRLTSILSLFIVLANSVSGALAPERIVVVANSQDPLSLEIASHYMSKRGIPEENLISIACPLKETITWDVFIQTIFNPLRKKLYDADWIEGSLSEIQDAEGRTGFASLGSNIDFMVLCRMPLRISNDKVRLERAPQKPQQKQFIINSCSVDSELSLIAIPNTPTIGFLPNPLYGKLRPSALALQQVVRVARLDGPSKQAILSLVDDALQVEAEGLRGRAYIDLGGPHAKGDKWIEEAANNLKEMDYPITWNRTPAAMGFDQRFDAPAFYFGWWKANITGAIREPDFKFAQGAVGWHLHSFSANSVRKDNFRWTGPLVKRGLTATVGNVYEPYLELTHHPHVFVEALKSGMSVGEAAYCALPALSWMSIFIGDPLYQPFKIGLDEQLESLSDLDDLDQYVVLREMERIQQNKGKAAALEYGQRKFHTSPGMALGFKNAQLARDLGKTKAAIKALGFAEQVPPPYRANEQGLVYQCAKLLWKLGGKEQAFRIMENIMSSPLPEKAREAYLPNALLWAQTLEKSAQLRKYSEMNAAIETENSK